MISFILVAMGAAICGFVALGYMNRNRTDIPPETLMLGQVMTGIIFGLVCASLFLYFSV